MYRKIIAVFISFALTLIGIQPGVASMIDMTMHTPDIVDMNHGGMNHMDMGHASVSEMGTLGAFDMDAMDHSCCPDHDDQAPCDGNCNAMSWLACAIHCGVMAPVYLSVEEFLVWSPYRTEHEISGVFLSAISVDDSPPFHPPKLFDSV